MTKRKLFLGGIVMSLFLTSTASAAITGTMNINGSVRVDATSIDWIPLANGIGFFNTVFPGTEFFSGIYIDPPAAPYIGIAKDLNAGSQPTGTSIFLDSFLFGFTAPGYGLLSFDLTYIFPSAAPVCTGAETTCTPFVGSPFTLVQNQTGVAVLFGLAGFFQSPGETDAYATGSYTTQLNGATIAGILQTVGTPGGFVDASYSANFTVVPEPSTTALLFAGLGALGIAARRKRF